MFVDIPSDRVCVFSEDGRVFYDLAELHRVYDETVSQREVTAILLDREDEAKGAREVVDAIRQSLEVLSAEASMVDRGDETSVDSRP